MANEGVIHPWHCTYRGSECSLKGLKFELARIQLSRGIHDAGDNWTNQERPDAVTTKNIWKTKHRSTTELTHGNPCIFCLCNSSIREVLRIHAFDNASDARRHTTCATGLLTLKETILVQRLGGVEASGRLTCPTGFTKSIQSKAHVQALVQIVMFLSSHNINIFVRLTQPNCKCE